MTPYSTISLNRDLGTGVQRNGMTPHSEILSFIVRVISVMSIIAMVVYASWVISNRNRELSKLRAEVQALDSMKRDQEKILVNLKMELSRLKDGASITVKARRLGLRPAAPNQMKYQGQMARHGGIVSTSRFASNL